MNDSIRSYKMIGVSLFAEYYPIFALPILSPQDDLAQYFIQLKGDYTETSCDFSEIAINQSAISHVNSDIMIDTNSPYYYAFIDRNRQLYISPASEMAQILNVALSDPATPLSTRSQIANILSLSDEIQNTRNELIYSISSDLGDRAGRSYANATARSRLWDILPTFAKDIQARARIRELRFRTDAWLNASGHIEIDTAEIDIECDLRISRDEIVFQLNQEFSGVKTEQKLRKTDLSGVSLDPTSDDILAAANRSPRQEERLAILLRALLTYPSAGLSALRRFDDRARYAQTATKLILSAVTDGMPEQERELRVAKLMQRLFSEAYPFSRGELLYYLAAYLGDFKHVNGALGTVLQRSHSTSVNQVRSAIEKLLRP